MIMEVYIRLGRQPDLPTKTKVWGTVNDPGEERLRPTGILKEKYMNTRSFEKTMAPLVSTVLLVLTFTRDLMVRVKQANWTLAYRAWTQLSKAS